MNRVSTVIVLALFAIAAIEFGLLGASAAGLTRSDRDLPPVAQRGALPPTSTNTPIATATPTPFSSPPNVSPPNVSPPPSSDLTGLFIQADPLAIVCNGSDTTWITARLFQPNGDPAPDGTWVYFDVDNGYADPYAVQTSSGYANTQVRLYGDGYYFGPNVVVSSGLLEGGIKVLCRPDSNSGCPLSPPAVSPPCGPTPPIDPCQISPPDAVSPPCEPTIPPGECHLSPPAISPPCTTPTPLVSPPDAGNLPFRIAIDCDRISTGVQDSCLLDGVSSHAVDVVLLNQSGLDLELAAFNFDLISASAGRLVPIEIPMGNLDDNPDFNQLDLTTDWACTPPEARGDIGSHAPASTVSFLSCFRTEFTRFPIVANGSSVVLASVSFDVAEGVPTDAHLSLTNLSASDSTLSEVASCGPYAFILAQCDGATIAIYGGGGPIATTVAPTNTPFPTATATHPPATPTRVRTTPTAPARTGTAAVTRTPTPKRLCADVDDDGRVRLRDVRRIAEAAARGTYDERYDINQDGRLSSRDVVAAIRQLGRRC